jgi:hypothetical protein
MADTDTGSLTVAQSSDPYTMWNSQEWFDNVRWGLTGTEVDSDFKAGLWWKDAEAMNAMVPDIRSAAQQWQKEVDEITDKMNSLVSSRTGLEANRGVDAARTQSAYDDMIKAAKQRIAELSPVPKALTNAADVIANGAPQVAKWWNKWEGDRANFEACHQDTVAMQPIISDMARAFLQAADATQQPFANALGMPQITVPKGNVSTLPKALQDHLSSDAANTSIAQKAAANAAGSVKAATNNTPGVVTGGAGTVSPGVSTAGTVVGGGSSTTTATPTLAGMGGASFNAPTVGGTSGLLGGSGAAGSAPGFAPGTGLGSSFAGAGGAGLGGAAGVGGGAGTGGTMPFMPGGAMGAGGSANRTRSTVEPGVSSSAPTTDDFLAPGMGGAAGSDKRKRNEVKPGVAPLIGGNVGRVDARRSVQIRPGDALRPRSGSAGVAEGLLGRAAKDAEFDDLQSLGAGRRRRQNKTREGADTLEFLDEDAWETDDPGTGVLNSDGVEQHGSVAGSTI